MRKKAGYTQKALAEALHITDKAVSKWERGLSLPDTSLLPKLSLILDTDIEAIISKSIEEEDWVGLIALADCDFSQPVFDKPLISYLLSHYLLLGITEIYIVTSESNEVYIKTGNYDRLGLDIRFGKPIDRKAMIIDHPWFLFGSDLTQQFRGAMLSERDTKLIPDNQMPVVYFSRNINDYYLNKTMFADLASKRTLGRGMICFDLGRHESFRDAATFIKAYQTNSGLLIGSLEEIAFTRRIISKEELGEYCKIVPYGELLSRVGKPAVD